jgi:cytochrome bd-type quinol oxidase subunit 1
MHVFLLWIGRLAGTVGVLVTALAVLLRVTGSYQLGSFQMLTVLQAGPAAMVMACLGYVAALAERQPASR